MDTQEQSSSASLTEAQQQIYTAVEAALMITNPTNEGFIDSMMAIEALGQSMRQSYINWRAKQH